MATRNAYTSTDEFRMWKFAYKKLAKNKDVSLKGLQIWKEYFDKYDDTRSVSSLSSHFRKKMSLNLIDSSLSIDEKLFIHRVGKVPLDLERFKVLCRTMGKIDLFNKHMELLEASRSSSEDIKHNISNTVRRRSTINQVVINDNDEINKVIRTCKISNQQKAPKLEEPDTSSSNDSENESLRVNLNEDEDNISVDEQSGNSMSLKASESIKISESMREKNEERRDQLAVNQVEETLPDGQGLLLRYGADSEDQQSSLQIETEKNDEPEPSLTVHEIKENVIREMCAETDSKLGVLVSLNVLLRKEIFYISACVTSKKDLIEKLDEFKEKFLKFISSEVDLQSFFLEIEKRDIVTFNRTKFETVKKVENSRISEEERNKYYRKAHLHLRQSPYSKLFRVQHRLQCIEAVAASLSSMKENFYYSIMEELFREIGLVL